ncbi:MAG: hypothetical protein RLZZ68_1236, partial [Bacteroidota bacterium]
MKKINAFVILCCTVLLGNFATTLHAQRAHTTYFTLQQYGQDHPETEICLSANNTAENQRMLDELGISIKQSTNQYLYFNADPQTVLNPDGTPKLSG